MRKLHQVMMLGLLSFAVASLAAPPAAAGPEAPLCTAKFSPDTALAGPQAVPADGVAPTGDLAAVAVGTPEPQPLFDPVLVPVPGPQCGLVVCPIGTRCCNPLCSACTPPGVSCTLGDCGHGSTS